MRHAEQVHSFHLGLSAAFLCGVVACAPEPTAEGEGERDPGRGGSLGADDDEGGKTTGGTRGQDDIEAPSSPGGAGGGQPEGIEGCATSSAQSSLTPVHLLFLLDQSGSMGDVPGLYEKRWVPATDALKSFVSDEASAGLYASLTFFPNNANTRNVTADPTFTISCDVDEYATPDVEEERLPSLEPFEAALAEVDPPNEYGTPTKVAYLGVAQYAEELLARGEKVAIVLITDGEPAVCPSDNDPDPLAGLLAAARELSDRALSYVIGMGSSLFLVDQIAEAGGTEMAYLIDLDNPDETRAQLLSQVKMIQDTQISCELPIPEPPKGESFEVGKVNVQLRADDEESTVLYNETCEEGLGWKYDRPEDPEMISLCTKSCEMVRNSNSSAVDVVFGCETKVVIR